MQTPSTLDAVRSIKDPAERAAAAVLYLARLHDREAEALAVRNAALAAAPLNAPALAAAVGVSVATVKAARRRPHQPERTP